MKDTLTQEDKEKLRRHVLMHQYDPPPFRAYMWECAMTRRHTVWGALFVWGHMWTFSRIWRLAVKRGA